MPDADLRHPLFDHDGGAYVPGPLCRGPWDDRHCHGGPIAALIARAVERLDRDDAWQIARLTIELERPMLVGSTVSLATDIERPGRKVSLVGVVATSEGVEIARARVLRIRDAAVDLPALDPSQSSPPLPPPETALPETPTELRSDLPTFVTDAMEHRVVSGSWNTPGPIELWMRLTVPVVADERPTGVQRAAATADFGNGVSSALPWRGFVFINPELTVHLGRRPQGEWIGLRAQSHYGDRGAGYAASTLFDTRGEIGRAAQSLYLDTR